jgi:hypothetical protein
MNSTSQFHRLLIVLIIVVFYWPAAWRLSVETLTIFAG